jgi:hypothetical protein
MRTAPPPERVQGLFAERRKQPPEQAPAGRPEDLRQAGSGRGRLLFYRSRGVQEGTTGCARFINPISFWFRGKQAIRPG